MRERPIIMSTTWRDRAAPIIAETIARVGRADMQALRKALRDAYPFGERAMWPYKVWCSEVRFQLGLTRKRSVSVREDEATRDLFA